MSRNGKLFYQQSFLIVKKMVLCFVLAKVSPTSFAGELLQKNEEMSW